MILFTPASPGRRWGRESQIINGWIFQTDDLSFRRQDNTKNGSAFSQKERETNEGASRVQRILEAPSALSGQGIPPQPSGQRSPYLALVLAI